MLTQHFPPEVAAGRFRVEGFARGLIAAGHELDVVCPVPNHPQGVIDDGFRRRAVVRRHIDGAAVSYVWVFTSPRKSIPTRLGYYGSYAVAASALGSALSRPDVVLASSPPLSVGAVGLLVAARHRVPWVFDVRDLWPEAAAALGAVTNRVLLGWAERLERWLYRRSNAILTVSDAFREHIAERAPRHAKIAVIPNGTTREWLDAGALEIDREAVGFPSDPFVWTYAGNVGLAHPLEDAVEAARLLGEGFRLVIIGDGPRRKEIQCRAAALPAGRVEFRDVMRPSDAARHLRASDALLVAERQPKTISAKLYDYCALSRPIIAVVEGEMHRLVEREGIALRIPPGDPEALAAAVRQLREDSDLPLRLGTHARSFGEGQLRERQAERLVALLEEVVNSSSSAASIAPAR